MKKKKKLLVKKKSSIPDKYKKRVPVVKEVKQNSNEVSSDINTPPKPDIGPTGTEWEKLHDLRPDVRESETPAPEPIEATTVEDKIESIQPESAPTETVTEIVEEPVVELPKKKVNTLLAEMLSPTDKDLSEVKKTVESISEVYSESDIEPDSDGKIEVSDKDLRAESRLSAVLHVSGVTFGLSELGNLMLSPADPKRYQVNQEGKAQFEKNLGDYYYLKAKLNKKRRNPGSALIFSAITIVGPILFAMVIDGIKRHRESKEKKAVLQKERAAAEQDRIMNMFREMKSAQTQEQGDFAQSAPIATRPIARSFTSAPKIKNGQKQNGGRHKASCPRSTSKEGVCNCR